MAASHHHPDDLVLGVDTVVVVDREIIRKPRDGSRRSSGCFACSPDEPIRSLPASAS
jgi:hypothetical protein